EDCVCSLFEYFADPADRSIKCTPPTLSPGNLPGRGTRQIPLSLARLSECLPILRSIMRTPAYRIDGSIDPATRVRTQHPRGRTRLAATGVCVLSRRRPAGSPVWIASVD